MKLLKVEEWELNHINSLMLDLILYATIATLIAALLALALHMIDMPQVRELLFAPWGIALVICVPVAFQRGVMAERARAEKK